MQASAEVDEAKAHFFEALDLLDAGNFPLAETRLRQALQLVPDRPSALVNLAIALRAQGKLGESRAVAERATVVAPDDPDAWRAFGSALSELRLLDPALEAMERALVLAPDHAEAFAARATIFAGRKQFDLAIADFQKALEIDPAPAEVRASLFSAKLQACDWRNLEDIMDRLLVQLRDGDAAFQPHILLSIASTPADQLLCASRFAERRYPPMPRLYQGERYEHRRLRIAYVSGDFREHPLPLLLVGTFEEHDRDRFETIGISFGPDDGSAIRERTRKSFDRFVEARNLSDTEIATLIHDERVDIAVDLGGHTVGGRPRVFAMRPAPVQVNYLGFPGTSGMPHLDYIIADRVVLPERHLAFFSEKPVWMPDTYYPHDSKRIVAETIPTRAAEGLPESAFVFGTFNNSRKILPDIFDIWMRLLKEVPGSVLWLLPASESGSQRLRQEAEERGVAPDRLVFAKRVPPEQHLARHKLADLLLDSPVRNAHTTACDALWAGVPILTLTGEAFAGRVATSILRAADIDELITETIDEYFETAVRLARNPSLLRRLREKAAASRRSPLFDTVRYTRNLESAYAAIVERHRRGDPPGPITVGGTN